MIKMLTPLMMIVMTTTASDVILAATDDQLNLALYSVHLYNDWVAAKKFAELHLLAKGGHGIGCVHRIFPQTNGSNFLDMVRGSGSCKKMNCQPHGYIYLLRDISRLHFLKGKIH